ncbi:MAG: glycosyltransferase [Bacteroidales bacterium]|nr:glycosyltransferase [Bacteroidales bacterium]
MMHLPKISIITATYNNKNTIEDTLHSLLTQTYKNLELIIIDGASSDGTLEIIEQYKNQVDIIVSEKDKGVYDALNKGLKLANGEVIGFLHADDTFYTTNTLALIASAFTSDGTIAVYGDLLYVDRNEPAKVIRYWRSKSFAVNLLQNGWMPAHPTLFFRRRVISEIGLFDTQYQIAADYDYMLRMLLFYPSSSFRYIPSVITCMKVGGKSNRSIKNILQKMKEDYLIIKKHNIGGICTLLLKNITKLSQLIRKKPIA